MQWGWIHCVRHPIRGRAGQGGRKRQAPLAALYLLSKGPENSIDPVKISDAARMLLENVLFFANDPELVGQVFESVCEFVRHVPVYRLIFFPDQHVWELIA